MLLPQPVVPTIPITEPLGILRLIFLSTQGVSSEYLKDKSFSSIESLKELGVGGGRSAWSGIGWS